MGRGAERFLAFIATGFGTGALGPLIGAGGGCVLAPVPPLVFSRDSPALSTGVSPAVVFFDAPAGSQAQVFHGSRGTPSPVPSRWRAGAWG